MSDATKDLRTALAEAFESSDSEAAWYYDRLRRRVVSVRHGETNFPELDASEVEEDEERFVDVPVVFESDVHAWIEEFVEEAADPAVAACFDARQGATARFPEALGRRAPEALPRWNTRRRGRVLERVDAFLAEYDAG